MANWIHRSFVFATTVVALSSHTTASAAVWDQSLGEVHFSTSCNAPAQAAFDKGMQYQHSFWYRSSQRAFEEALAADPKCAIAYWGIALSVLWNPHTITPLKNLTEGAAALAKGRALGAKTIRERDYLESISPMYENFEKVEHRVRVLNYVKAMEKLALRYPDDDEAQILYALALNVGASPTDKTYSDQLKGAAILEKIWLRQPNHPGIAHYLIHLYDSPALAEKGLEAAKRYSKIAPDAAHAQHMPSHIFTRVGYWTDSIASNVGASRVAKSDNETDDQLHAMDYLVYAYLQLGQDANAKATIDEMKTVKGFSETFIGGPYALAASPARYVLERGDWKSAAALEVRPSVLPYVQALTYFAKAVGAARSGSVEAAQFSIDKLTELRDQLQNKRNATKRDAYWAEQVDIQRQIAVAWAMKASGKNDEALKAMSDAADAEDRTEKNPVTPGPLMPARELYGAMLQEMDKPTEALVAFEMTLQKEPKRLSTAFNAARSAEKAGDATKARRYYSQVAELTVEGDSGRPEVKDTRAYLAKQN